MEGTHEFAHQASSASIREHSFLDATSGNKQMTAWESVLDSVTETLRLARSWASSVWFRGEAREGWYLRSSLHRDVLNTQFALNIRPTHATFIDLLWKQYKSYFYKYQRTALGELNIEEMNDWGTVFSMQHHGVPTPLLDWTESFACALYFASADWESNSSAVVYMLDPEVLNDYTVGVDSLIGIKPYAQGEGLVDTDAYLPSVVAERETLPAIAIAPPFTNSRIKSQDGRFLLCGSSFRPLEIDYSHCIHKIVLPPDAYDDAQRFLELVGSSHGKYFPGLDGTATDLRADRRWELEEIARVQFEG